MERYNETTGHISGILDDTADCLVVMLAVLCNGTQYHTKRKGSALLTILAEEGFAQLGQHLPMAVSTNLLGA